MSTPRTRLERSFDPAAVRALKDAADADLSVGGATLAASALRAGLVDECRIYLAPVVVGGGTPWLPDGLRLRLRLLDEQRFAERHGPPPLRGRSLGELIKARHRSNPAGAGHPASP